MIHANNQRAGHLPQSFKPSNTSQFTTGSKYSENYIEGHIALVAIKSFITILYKSATAAN
jgi:hypothetical protein